MSHKGASTFLYFFVVQNEENEQDENFDPMRQHVLQYFSIKRYKYTRIGDHYQSLTKLGRDPVSISRSPYSIDIIRHLSLCMYY